jgi:hypothetical protein
MKVGFISIFRRFHLIPPSESHSPDSADSLIFCEGRKGDGRRAIRVVPEIPKGLCNPSRWLSAHAAWARYHRQWIFSATDPWRGRRVLAPLPGCGRLGFFSGGVGHFVRSTTGYGSGKPSACCGGYEKGLHPASGFSMQA